MFASVSLSAIGYIAILNRAGLRVDPCGTPVEFVHYDLPRTVMLLVNKNSSRSMFLSDKTRLSLSRFKRDTLSTLS